MSGMDLAISLLKFVPTNAKVKSKVTPNPKDMIVIGVIIVIGSGLFTTWREYKKKYNI